jgi:ABC-type transport system substrate-binding protein
MITILNYIVYFFILIFQELIRPIRTIFSRRFIPNLIITPGYFSKIERWIIVGAIILLLISGLGLGASRALSFYQLKPNYGGTFTEGILATTVNQLETIRNNLTQSGLTRFDAHGQVQPDLAERWEISPDGLIYTFYLRKNIQIDDLLASLKAKKEWQGINIIAQENKIVFQLNQAFSPFLAQTTDRIFPIGPYLLESLEQERQVFVANNQYFLGRPYLDKVIIRIFQDESLLAKAVKKKEVQAILTKEALQPGMIFYQYSLPRWKIIFFNLQKEVLKDVKVRRAIIDHQDINPEIKFTLVTSSAEQNIRQAQDFKTNCAKHGVNIEIKKVDAVTLQREIIPKRDYDLLLYNIDYGYDPDPYPLWHSSQIKPDGMNLSNFSSKKVDKLLEASRLTTDLNLRTGNYQEIQRILNEEGAQIVLEQAKFQYIVDSNIKGIQSGPVVNQADRFNGVEKWYIKTKRVKK